MKRIISLCLVLVLSISMLFSCGAASKGEASFDAAYGGDYNLKDEAEYLPPSKGDYETSGDISAEAVNRKQIKNATMRLQTKEYEQFMAELSTVIDSFGGFVQSSSQNGTNYGSTANRSSYVVARIPAENFEGFKAAIADKCNVVHLDESVRDVTTAYTSLESKIAVLEAEESSLVAMLENAQKYIDESAKNYTEIMSTMLTIKDQLLNVQAQLASYRAELKSYASQVSYSTVSMNIYEVDRLIVVEEPETMWEEIGNRFSENIYDIGQDARGFFVWFVASLPYLVIWGAIISLVVFLLIRFKKHKKKKGSANMPKNNEGTKAE